jgi:hypothetical protein
LLLFHYEVKDRAALLDIIGVIDQNRRNKIHPLNIPQAGIQETIVKQHFFQTILVFGFFKKLLTRLCSAYVFFYLG